MTANTSPSISPLRPNDPTRLGPYRLTGRIGRGGMGTVYLADTDEGERVAVKVINPDLADDDSFRDRFRREVKAARRVRRFCTAPVIDAQLDGDTLYIVTEYVDGPNLEDIVAAHGPLRGANLEGLAVGMATALTAIHGAGVVHRDLKPANVLLSSVGPRVIDFGIARALDTVAQATRTGLFIGTPSYMAPELVSGEKATPASDIFAWGCVMAFAATGRTLFEATTAPAVLYKIVHSAPELDDVDPALRGIVERSLAKDPGARPTAQQLLDHLLGQEHADTALGADTAELKWPAGTGSARDATLPVAPDVPARRPQPPERDADSSARFAAPHDPAMVSAPGGPLQPGSPAETAAAAVAPPVETPVSGPPTAGPPPAADPPLSAAASAAPPPADPSAGPHPAARPVHGAGGGKRRRWPLIGGLGAAVVLLAATAITVVLYLQAERDAPPTATTEFYGDDFGDTRTGWPGGDYSSTPGYGYSAGAYRIDAGSFVPLQVHEAPLRSPIPERVLISAAMRVTSGPPYGQVGLWCRGSTDPTGYQFLVRADGKEAVIRKVAKNAGRRELAKGPVTADYDPRGTNTVQIGCEKAPDGPAVRLRLWLNGDLVAEATDDNSPLATGRAGMVLSRERGGGGGLLTAYFDNFTIDEVAAE